MCEAWAKRNLTITYADQNSSWFINNENKPASLGQISYLKKKNIYKTGITMTEASTMIRKIIAQSQHQRKKMFEVRAKMPKTFYNTMQAQKPINKEYI